MQTPPSPSTGPAKLEPACQALQAKRDLAFLVLASLFIGTLGLLNVLGISRFLQLGSIAGWPIVVAVGVLPYPVTFLCTDLISEIWGERRAAQVVWMGLGINLWVWFLLWLGGVLPGAGIDVDVATGQPLIDAAGREPVFFEIRRQAFGTIGGSMVAYITAQFADVRLFHFWKRFTKGKYLWIRNNGSTMVSQLVDTAAVILIAHYASNALPIDPDRNIVPQLLSLIASGYLYKLICALLDTFPFIWLTGWLRRVLKVEGEGRELGRLVG
ncbi:MAG: VUT family protein [Aphanocapsa feldmannii 277cV]|uniref:Probable queuosine precursor transporter n=2 Tax=Aphanocapsa feldmannii TaxID=192050 RepID=A0A524RM30_9CHRO|nr:MAG: VUT family protein [Aphanocapsa feldmannii 288cV]TGG91239.1 MAG: VUT family protein [Aphanocapsa feldmannii 277cV]TGH18403.1 MAG: VUT family protein [Aphanocapsa feldmannii 277cI]